MGTSTTKDEFQHKSGERYETRKPRDSGILKGEGKFETQTVKSAEFGTKQGERYDIKKREVSDIWKVCF